MTHRNGVADSHDLGLDLGPRWRLLAERRLEHLTELFESGRWRRYYSERAFLEDIQQAKAAVAHWRNLSMPQPIETAKPNGVAVEQAAPIIMQANAVVELAASASEAASEERLPAPMPSPGGEQAAQSNATEARFVLLRNML